MHKKQDCGVTRFNHVFVFESMKQSAAMAVESTATTEGIKLLGDTKMCNRKGHMKIIHY